MDSKHTSPSCLLIFQDDSLVCSYADGSALETSPCGAAFIHMQAARSSELHPLLKLHRETIQQRTIYVTSEYKEKLQYAVDIRNRFSTCPYIASNLLRDSDYILDTYADIREVNWSAALDEAYIDVLDNGGIRLRSLDECSSIVLAASNLDFSVEYLCKISDGSAAKDSKWHCNSSLSEESAYSAQCDPDRSGDARRSSSHAVQFSYVWMIQHLSVAHCPLAWQHPLQLVVEFKQRRIFVMKVAKERVDLSEASSIAEDAHEEETDDALQEYSPSPVSIGSDGDGNYKMADISITNSFFTNRSRTMPSPDINATYENSVKVQLPSSLPSKCPASHQHRWRKISGRHRLDGDVDFDALLMTNNCALKMMMANGVIYRFFLDPVSSEIYPGDGSVITLKDSRGQYFTHTTVNKDGSTSEKMFLANNQAMLGNTVQSSLIRMVNKASRLLNVMLSNTTSCVDICWKVSKPVSSEETEELASAVPIEETTVPGVGHFVALSNGQLRVVFTDRTILNMVAGEQRTQDLPDDPYGSRGSQICQIVLPSGQRRKVSIQNPGYEFSRYVKMAVEWLEWVQMSHSSREILTNTQSQEEDFRTVQIELEKLKCFNYILDNTNVSRAADIRREIGSRDIEMEHNADDSVVTTSCVKSCMTGAVQPEREQTTPLSEVVPSEVHDVLHKTSQIICGIDNLLNK